MSSQSIIMGMIFSSGSEPDFGSIYAVKRRNSGVNDYGLNEADVGKLDLITNAVPGSTALCDDTGNLYRKTKSGWVKFGGNTVQITSASELSSNSNSASNSVSGSLDSVTLTDKADVIEPSEFLTDSGEELSLNGQLGDL